VTQLVYHPAFDPYNALLRTCRLLDGMADGTDVAALRVLDFLLLFPEHLAAVRLSPALKGAVRRLKAQPRFPYDRLPTPRALFRRMAAPYEAAVQTLVSRGLVDVDEKTGDMRLNEGVVPPPLMSLAKLRNEEEADLMSVLLQLGGQYSAYGPNGLKDRSHLDEFLYDAV
jgi:hypothetical protein